MPRSTSNQGRPPMRRCWCSCSFARSLACAVLAAVLLTVPGIAPCAAQPAATPAQAHSPGAEARRWLDDAKFGLFVHWGVSALVGKGEWLMEQDRLPISEYEKLPPRFHPGEFDAER